MGENRTSGAIPFDPVLLESIIKYKGCNCRVFGVKSDKKPVPIEVNKLFLIIIYAGILGHCAVVEMSAK